MRPADSKKAVALAEYREVLAQFRALTAIRFKLLAYLPLGTAALAVFLSRESSLLAHPALPAFALIATVCIATYNKRNDQLYDELVGRAAQIEREDLGLIHGSFAHRPQAWLKFAGVPVEHRWPIGFLYACATALWASLLAAAVLARLPAEYDAPWPEYLAPAVVIAAWFGLRQWEKARKQALQEAVRSVIRDLLLTDPSSGRDAQDDLTTALLERKGLFGVKATTAAERIAYHWHLLGAKPDPHSASVFLGAVIDFPPRWIHDICSGRREGRH